MIPVERKQIPNLFALLWNVRFTDFQHLQNKPLVVIVFE